MIKRGLFFSLFFFSVLSIVQGQTHRVACVGNSVTYGAGIENRERHSYPAQLQALLGDNYEVRNFGKSGATLLTKGHRPYILQEEYQQALSFCADRVIIHLGLNDTDPRNWPDHRDEFVRDYLSLIDSFRQANPKALIWICRMSPITHAHKRFRSGTRDWYWQIQKEIERVAAVARVGLIDLQEPLYARPDLLPDALHPNAEGAGLIAQVVCSALTGDYGGLRLAPIYSDQMVLQRDKPLRIEGIANAGEPVTLTLGTQTHTTRAGADGKWTITLDPLSVGEVYTMEVTAPSGTLRFNDILAGEVWLCSGQSNMAFELRQSVSEEVEQQLAYAATAPTIRFYDQKALWPTNAVEWDKMVMDSLNALHYFRETSWQACDAQNVKDLSAIAFAFGRMLNDSLQVPIGLIVNAIGGSPTEAWIDRKSIEFNFPEIITDWTANDFIQPWVRERARQNIRQSERKGQRHPYEPVFLFESGIQPLDRFPIRGVIWYQGESNAHNIEAHERLFPLLIESWRRYWNESFPFYYAQLSGINRPSWPWFRDSQRRMMTQIPRVAMAVSSDRGDSLDVHPRQKREIGERLARWALQDTYGKALIPSGPIVEKAIRTGDAVQLFFGYNHGMTASDGAELRTFEVAETEGLYYPATAVVENDYILLRCDSVFNPRYVRYGWQPFTRANLVNGVGLPASTFRITIENNKETTMKWTKLPDLPGTANTASLGVSAPFVGVWNDRLIVAGGCNFPDKPVTEGGGKRYYNEIFSFDLQKENGEWEIAGHLPFEVAYGASVTTSEGVVCIGGNNNKQAFRETFLLTSPGGRTMETEVLPALPLAMDNLAAAVIGRVVYAVGGNLDGKTSKAFYSLDLNNREEGWVKLPAYPGSQRVQPVLAAQENGTETLLYLAGGFQPMEGDQMVEVPTNVLVYSPTMKEWKEESLLPSLSDGRPRTLTGGCAVPLGEHRIAFVGGVNYDCFSAAIDRPRQLEVARANDDQAMIKSLEAAARSYMFHPVEWYNFNKELLVYNCLSRQWEVLGSHEPLARAGAGAVAYKDQLILINGELKPGVRTPAVNSLSLSF